MATLAFISKFPVVVRIRMELEVSSQNNIFLLESPFCYSWFRLQLIAIHCNRRLCEQNTLTPRIFSHICTHVILVHMHRMAQGVAARDS